jgi:hypothetical protein
MEIDDDFFNVMAHITVVRVLNAKLPVVSGLIDAIRPVFRVPNVIFDRARVTKLEHKVDCLL